MGLVCYINKERIRKETAQLELTIEKNLINESKQSVEKWISVLVMLFNTDCPVARFKNYLGDQHFGTSVRGFIECLEEENHTLNVSNAVPGRIERRRGTEHGIHFFASWQWTGCEQHSCLPHHDRLDPIIRNQNESFPH